MISFKVENLKNMNEQLKEFSDFLRRENVLDDDIFAVKLVSCELITNVIRHGREPAEFCGQLSDDTILIKVTAKSLEGVNFDRLVPDVFAENGRGLYIVQSFCQCLECSGSGEVSVQIKRH